VLGGLPQTNSRSLDVQRSLVAGKNAGNLADSAAFREICLENTSESSSFETNSLRGYADEQGNILREQEINSGFWTGAGNSPPDRVSSRLRK
jgi:hypothetical protein